MSHPCHDSGVLGTPVRAGLVWGAGQLHLGLSLVGMAGPGGCSAHWSPGFRDGGLRGAWRPPDGSG